MNAFTMKTDPYLFVARYIVRNKYVDKDRSGFLNITNESMFGGKGGKAVTGNETCF